MDEYTGKLYMLYVFVTLLSTVQFLSPSYSKLIMSKVVILSTIFKKLKATGKFM